MTVRPAPVFSVLDHCGTVSVLFREKMTNKVGPADDAGQVSSIAIFFEKKSHTFDFSNEFMQEPLNIFRGPWFSGLISERFSLWPKSPKRVAKLLSCALSS